MSTNQHPFLINSKVYTSLPQKGSSDSRIIQKKQIQKRLQGLSIKQYDRISKNLLKQNQKLKQQVQTLGDKVKKLIQSKKYPTQHKPDPLIESKILETKKQLSRQYQQMNQLKEQLSKQTQNHLTQEIKTNLKEKKNTIKSMQKSIQQLLLQKNNLIQEYKNNNMDFEEYIPKKEYVDDCERLREENAKIKKNIYEIMGNIKNNEKMAQNAISKLYTLKKQDDLKLNKNNRIKSLSLLHKPNKQQNKLSYTIQSSEKNQLKSLQQQIKRLKKTKTEIQTELETDKQTKQSKRNRIQKNIRNLLENHKQLFKNKIRSLTQLNYYEQKQSQTKAKLLKNNQQQQSITLAEKHAQTDNIINKIYRKDWIGNNQGLTFNDSDHLEFKQSCFIKSLTVYRTIDHIVFIKFHYQNAASKKKYESKLPFDKEILKKIQAKRIVSKDNGYLVNVIVSMTKSIVTKVQTRWSDGDSLVQGWDTEESDKFKFDIGERQRPICFFGTFTSHPKTIYTLSSIGCEILQSSE